jgi:hypothetical protein
VLQANAQKEVPAQNAGTSRLIIAYKRKLGSAALTVAVLIVLFVFVRPLITLLGLVLVLPGLTLLDGLLALSVLPRLRTLLSLSELVALLILHIVCHEIPP